MRPDLVFHGPVPQIAGTKSGPLLIVGPGWTLKDDLEACRTWRSDVMAVSAAGMFVRAFDHWFSPHPEYVSSMNHIRGFLHLDSFGGPVHSTQGSRGADIMWPIRGNVAMSGGIQACVAAVAMGYAPIVIAGMPADGQGHCYPHPPERGWKDHYDHGQEMFLSQWRWLRDNYFAGKVKSLSGKTMEILNG